MNYKKEYERAKTKLALLEGSLLMIGLAMVIVIGIIR